MCRIFGGVSKERLPRSDLNQAGQAMFEGGPDEQWIAAEANWAAGTNRLAIQGVSGGKQPFRFKNLVCVFNGEIYNHNALRQHLVAKGHSFADTCDGNVLLPLFDRYGKDMLPMLEGMFTFAIFTLDEEKRCVSVFLACDHAAMKTVFYRVDETGFYFASSLKSLRHLVRHDLDLRDGFAFEYVARKSVWGPNTVYDGVNVLGAGETLTFSSQDGACKKNTYTHSFDTVAPNSLNEAAEQFDLLIDQEIEKMASMDVDFCSILSGGLDSSLVTSLLRKKNGRLDAFHIGYDGRWPGDESHYAQMVADAQDINLHKISVDVRNLPQLVKSYIAHLDQPNYAPHCLSTYYLFKEVHDRGYKVTFSGEGADELFCGYSRLIAAASSKRDDWFETFFAVYGISAFQGRNLFRQDYLDSLDQDSFAPTFDGTVYPNRAQNILHYDSKKRFPYYILRRVDSLSMASSVEVRMPFLQPRIIDFARKLPSAFLYANGVGKQAVLKAGAKHLPSAIIHRKKQPFTFPIGTMIAELKPIQDYVFDTVFSQNAILWDYFDHAQIQALKSTQIDTSAASVLWALLVLQEWHDANVQDRKGATNDRVKESGLF
ncbi:asparagine synthase (glutamine-hydrolyzing) [Actibacterium lipolyticum]|uniref:asparagine synthase (glutamine-hydrolyzing) n=1 Tax=Actibacterium lipolyticum TaxID=1524263 RepID=A0A238L866_9RHOB|nr:asparagine synthase (glutamine-hydrolyzing) [Actibacterium lipolyticum]SMX51197.1 Asparagine synthetase [glutamine-hydrolyzing] 3 [Actibacterium lipolyticum]